MHEIHPGAVHLPSFLSLDEQTALLARCRALGAAPAGLYRPTVRGGGRMHVDLCCLGMHWNPVEYRYEATRSDHDGLPVQPLPPDLAALARRAAEAAGMTLAPDICLMTFYPEDGGLGLHQDKDERPETIAAGAPIVSLSLGDSARFRVGGFHAEGAGRDGRAGVGRRLRAGRPEQAALPRRAGAPRRHRARGAWPCRALQSVLPAVSRARG